MRRSFFSRGNIMHNSIAARALPEYLHNDQIERAFSIVRTVLSSPERFNLTVKRTYHVHIVLDSDDKPGDTYGVGDGDTPEAANINAINDFVGAAVDPHANPLFPVTTERYERITIACDLPNINSIGIILPERE